MKKFNYKVLLAIGIMCLSKLAIAQVIELDELNPDTCRKQLMTAEDQFPVVLEYIGSDKAAQDFMPLYVKFAAKHPEHAFFTYDAEHANWQVQALCLQETGLFISPSVKILYKVPVLQGYLSTVIRAESGRQLTERNLEWLIRKPLDQSQYNFLINQLESASK